MATLLNRSFEFIVLARNGYDSYGNDVLGVVSRRTVRGTIQPLSGQEAVIYFAGNRDSGSVKVYSSEKLSFRSEEKEELGYIKHEGKFYELVQEMSYHNMFSVGHFKYIASMIPPSQVPEALK